MGACAREVHAHGQGRPLETRLAGVPLWVSYVFATVCAFERCDSILVHIMLCSLRCLSHAMTAVWI